MVLCSTGCVETYSWASKPKYLINLRISSNSFNLNKIPVLWRWRRLKRVQTRLQARLSFKWYQVLLKNKEVQEKTTMQMDISRRSCQMMYPPFIISRDLFFGNWCRRGSDKSQRLQEREEGEQAHEYLIVYCICDVHFIIFACIRT